MARTTQTICMTLEPKYVEILKKIKEKKNIESLSGTFRFLLNWYEEKKAQAELERQYNEYFSDPKNVRREKKLTKEMLGISCMERKPAFSANRRIQRGKGGAR